MKLGWPRVRARELRAARTAAALAVVALGVHAERSDHAAAPPPTSSATSAPAEPAAPLFVLGARDHRADEFAQRDYAADYYPDRQPVAMLAKELNLTWHTAQYFHFPLTAALADRGVTFELEPTWADGHGTLRIAAEVWRAGAWRQTGSTLITATNGGTIDIPSGFLTAGTNDIRLRATAGTGGTTVVVWDQVVIAPSPFTALWQVGTNDGSERELAQDGYQAVYEAGAGGATFPKELNTTWWTAQTIRFDVSADQAQRAAVLSLDAMWNDGAGALVVALERQTASGWERIDTAQVSEAEPARMIIPAAQLEEGENTWRLVGVSGTKGTSVVVWDHLALYQRSALPGGTRDVLETVLDTTLQYFLSPRAITTSGLPLTALKVLDRARFGYSNPTEWGFALEAWMVAAERGLITPNDARARIERAVATMRLLEDDPAQFHDGLFYPYYIVVAPNGEDVPVPYHSEYTQLPSGDCALLWASLYVTRGWLLDRGFTDVAQAVADVQAKMSFRTAYFARPPNAFLSMLVDAKTEALSKYTWYYWADEGGVVAMVSHLAGSTTEDELRAVLATQQRGPHAWRGHVVADAAYFNAMFTWAQRSLLGFPIRGDARARSYAVRSFAPAVAAHLDYGDQLGIDYPAFSDAMTQTDHGHALVGRYTPPNIEDRAPSEPPAHITPHALAVPFCIVDVLDERTLQRLSERLLRLEVDRTEVWHPLGTQDPFGFEVVASPRADVASYPGPDEGRYIFETLSSAYTALSIYDGLQRYPPGRGRTFDYFASRVPGYSDAVAKMLAAASR